MALPNFFGVKSYGSVTQTAGTVINRLVEPMANAYSLVLRMIYINQANQHVITALRPLGSTTFAADAAAGQAVVVLTVDPGVYLPTSSFRTANNAIAAGDYVCYQAADGTYVFDTVASGTYAALTLTTNLPTLGVLAGAPFWFFGIKTDLNPNDGVAHPTFTAVPAGSGYGVKEFVDETAGIVASIGKNEPILLQSDNLTAAGILNQVVAAYTNRGGPNSNNTYSTNSATASL
jgi:hypothetical protein